MSSRFLSIRFPVILLVLFLGESPVLAQDEAEESSQPTPEQVGSAESEISDQEARQEQAEDSADIREAIHENLDLQGVVDAEYKKNKRYIHIKIKVPNIPSHRTFNRNSGQAGQLPVLVSEF